MDGFHLRDTCFFCQKLSLRPYNHPQGILVGVAVRVAPGLGEGRGDAVAEGATLGVAVELGTGEGVPAKMLAVTFHTWALLNSASLAFL